MAVMDPKSFIDLVGKEDARKFASDLTRQLDKETPEEKPTADKKPAAKREKTSEKKTPVDETKPKDS